MTMTITRVWRVSYEPSNRVLSKFVLILSFTFRFRFAKLLRLQLSHIVELNRSKRDGFRSGAFGFVERCR